MTEARVTETRMAETRWLDDGEARAWRAHIDGVHLLLKVLDRQLQQDAGLSFADYELLVALSEAPDRRLRMRDLAEVTFGTRSGVTRAISRLEAQGWVRRRECADDGRGTEAQLTPAGRRKLAASATGHVEAVRRHVFDVLTPTQVRSWGNASVALRAGLLDGAHSDQAHSDQARPDQARPDQARPDQSRSTQSRSDHSLRAATTAS